MQFSGRRQVSSPTTTVWAGLHDSAVLRDVLPGCRDLVPAGDGEYAAALQARVGPVCDTYRGRFSIHDLRPDTELRVRVDARGRCGRLQVDLRVTLVPGPAGTTVLHYCADATVGGLASRLGTATLTVTGGHFTGCFFRALDRELRRRPTAPVRRPASVRAPVPAGV